MPPSKAPRLFVVTKCLEFDAAYNPLSSATDDEIRNDLRRLQSIDRAAKAAPYVCSVSRCGYKTPHKGNFDRHEKLHDGDIGEAHVCSVPRCGYKTHQPRALTAARDLPLGVSSKFKGVYRSKGIQKWRAQTSIDGKMKHLGVFDSEEAAARKRDEAVASLGRPLNFPGNGHVQAVKGGSRGGSSKFKGVSWNSGYRKWKAQIKIDGKQKYLGSFDSEEAAARKYDEAAASLSRVLNFQRPQSSISGQLEII
jgi:hypothetical protein